MVRMQIRTPEQAARIDENRGLFSGSLPPMPTPRCGIFLQQKPDCADLQAPPGPRAWQHGNPWGWGNAHTPTRIHPDRINDYAGHRRNPDPIEHSRPATL